MLELEGQSLTLEEIGAVGRAELPVRLGAEARARIEASGRDVRLEIDGGVKPENAAEIARAGADTLVAGSAIFGSSDYAATIRSLRAQAELGQRSRPAR